MAFVLDASVAVAWFVRSQATAYTRRIRVLGKKEPIHVPALWRQEVVNAVWQAQKRALITADAASTAVELLAQIDPVVHEKTRHVRELFDLCRTHDLSAYDATYLGLAVDLKLPIACKDGPLRLALSRAGLKLA